MKTGLRMKLATFVLTCTTIIGVHAQPFTVKVNVANQPENPIELGWISGDDFHKIDSAKAFNGAVQFQFPPDAHPGVYRLVFGKTGYARVMNDDPQTLDFIFNDENIELQTDFKAPFEAAQILHSNENQLYFDFMKRQQEYERALLIMEKQLDQIWNRKDTAGAIDMADEFNRLQMEWDLRVMQIVQQNSETFASRLIKIQRKALKDGFLSPEERLETLKKTYFNLVNFDDESLINSPAYTDKVFKFLLLFNKPTYSREQRITAYEQAVDTILAAMGDNKKVKDFIVAYLYHGFEVLEMPEVNDHIKSRI